MKQTRFAQSACALALLLTGTLLPAQTVVRVFTYNNRTPFVVNPSKQEGLEYRLCTWLTKESKGQFQFLLKVTTAEEIRTLLEADKLDGVVMGVNQSWFSEAIRKKSLWTPAILFDKNIVLSLNSKKVDFTGPASLLGLRVAVVTSWVYAELGENFSNGKIHRLDNPSEPMALRAVAEGKADAAIVSEWTYLYEQLRGDLQGDFFTADQPALSFTRKILVPSSKKPVFDYLCKVLADVKHSSGWQEATSL